MITAGVIFSISYVAIALGKVPASVIALIGAMLMVFLGVVSGEQALDHVDLNVILLLVGMMTLAEILGRSGVFEWAAIRSAQLVRGNGFLILTLLVLITAVASAFLDNVTTVVLMVPVTLSLCMVLGLKPLPFLLAEVFASNIGGTATVIGDPPNIIVASVAHIDFLTFMVNIGPVTLISTAVLLLLLFIWFRRDVRVHDDKRQDILTQSPGEAIKDKALLTKSLVVFSLTVVGFLTHDLFSISPTFIALAGASTLLLISGLEPREVLQGVEWNTIAFFTGLFILVGGLVETGVTGVIQKWMIDVAGGNEWTLALILVWFGGTVSSIVDNIPYTATIVQVVNEITAGGNQNSAHPLWWALTLGADLGGNATIVGASANVVVVTIARSRGYPIGFLQFFKYGLVIGGATLIVSSLYLWLRFYLPI